MDKLSGHADVRTRQELESSVGEDLSSEEPYSDVNSTGEQPELAVFAV